MVSISHSLFLFLKGNPIVMDSAKYALYAKWLEGIDILLLNQSSTFCLNEMECPSKEKINPHGHRQRHLNKGVARLGNKLNSPWTTRNVGHVNNKEGKSQ